MSEGVHTFGYHLDGRFFANMESADIHDADLTVNLTVEHKHDVYTMAFAIAGTVTLVCDRCLDALTWPIDVNYHINVRYGEAFNDEADDLLEIPFSNDYLNVAYMIYDTVALSIPIKHVHPLGKCNRQMSAMLKKHRARQLDADSEDAELEDSLIDEIDVMSDDDNEAPTDPRWDALKGLSGSTDK